MSAPERRELSFASWDELSTELDRIERAGSEGRLRTTGNWTPGQNLQHVGKLIRFSYDGFPVRVSLAWRLLGRLLRGVALKRPLKPGLKFPKGAEALAPDDEVAFEDGLAALREQAARIERGEQMTQPSPILGPMRHEDWTRLHLSHAAMHLGFLRYD